MAAIDLIYHNLLREIMDNGYDYVDPNRKKQGVKRRQINKFNFDYNMKRGFPAITTKKLAWKSVVGETLWFLRGDTNIKPLVDAGIPIWNKDAYNYYVRRRNNIDKLKDREPITFEDFVDQIKKRGDIGADYGGIGYVGKNYGYQLRSWTGKTVEDLAQVVDQLQDLVNTLLVNPMATKKIVTYWNPAEKVETALTPCHRSWEVMVRPLVFDTGLPKYELSLSFDMSSVDVFLGLPFNIASYGLILHILACMTGMTVGTLSGNLTNVHIYHPHFEAVEEQLQRDVFTNPAPELQVGVMIQSALKDRSSVIDETLEYLEISDFKLKGYRSFPSIKAPMLAYDS